MDAEALGRAQYWGSSILVKGRKIRKKNIERQREEETELCKWLLSREKFMIIEKFLKIRLIV